MAWRPTLDAGNSMRCRQLGHVLIHPFCVIIIFIIIAIMAIVKMITIIILVILYHHTAVKLYLVPLSSRMCTHTSI